MCLWTGARFTNDFLTAIQIWWKLHLAIIPLLAIRSQQILAHAMTAQLSCHVQNFVAITVSESRGEWKEGGGVVGFGVGEGGGGMNTGFTLLKLTSFHWQHCFYSYHLQILKVRDREIPSQVMEDLTNPQAWLPWASRNCLGATRFVVVWRAVWKSQFFYAFAYLWLSMQWAQLLFNTLRLRKMAAISRRHFQMHFYEWKCIHFD